MFALLFERRSCKREVRMTMGRASLPDTQNLVTRHRVFASLYEWLARGRGMRGIMDPLRTEAIEQARGVVLEVGAGTGLNFAFYRPGQVERVEAVEPDDYMRRFALRRIAAARVPISLTAAPVEVLPFEDGSFDSALATLVFCSVQDPERGLLEVRRVLRPNGTLILVEHVRSHVPLAARVQDAVVPLTTRFTGN